MEIVAHRAGNTPQAAREALGHVDMIELDVHVLRGQVEVRHAKVLRPTNRLWEKWFLLPAGSAGVVIEAVLDELPPSTPLMIDLKCFTRRAARRIERAIPNSHPIVASTRTWWTLRPFASRPGARVLRSCGTRWQLWWALHAARYGPQQGICVHERRLTSPALKRMFERTSMVFTWGATTAARCRELAHAGVTGVILDDYMLAPRDQPPSSSR